MNSSPENFDQLKKLFALKRHEQPPPGFFTHFPDKVIARIEAEGLTTRVAWWRQIFANLEAKPVLACAYGALVGGLLIVGMGLSRSAESDDTDTTSLGKPWLTATPVASAWVLPATQPPLRHLGNQTDISSSVTPVVSSGSPSPFFAVPKLATKEASFTIP